MQKILFWALAIYIFLRITRWLKQRTVTRQEEADNPFRPQQEKIIDLDQDPKTKVYRPTKRRSRRR